MCQVPPRSFSLQDHEVVVSQPLELDRGADSAEAGTDDHDVELLLGHASTVPKVGGRDEARRGKQPRPSALDQRVRGSKP